MSTYQNVVTNHETTTREAGRVKWFNNKSGYGFITRNSSNDDVFVHHSAIKVEQEQYKYLVQGEYVEFELEKATKGDYEFQATSITGIKGGKLMCETRQINRPQEEGERRPVRRYRLQDDRDRSDGDFAKVPQRRQYGGRGGRGGRTAPPTTPVQEQSM